MVLLADEAVPLIANSSSASETIRIVGRAAVLFFSIVIVSYEYIWFTTIMRWPTTFRDTLIPHLLGLAEIVPAKLLESGTAWWIATGTFTCIGTLAFLNTITRLHVDAFGGAEKILAQTRRLLYCLAAMTASASTASFMAVWIRENYDLLSEWVDVWVPWAILALAIFIIQTSERRLNTIYVFYDVPRRPTLAATLNALLARTR